VRCNLPPNRTSQSTCTFFSGAGALGGLGTQPCGVYKGADVKAQDNDGWTALIWASRNGREAIARLLIDKGADVKAQTNDGSTALVK